MVKEQLADNLYVLTDYVLGGKKNFFLDKDFVHKLKYLKEETPIVLPEHMIESKERIYIPSLGGFTFSRKQGDSFIYLKTEEGAMNKANELLEEVCAIYNTLNENK